jgi:hypothetical protein
MLLRQGALSGDRSDLVSGKLPLRELPPGGWGTGGGVDHSEVIGIRMGKMRTEALPDGDRRVLNQCALP